MNPSLDRSWFLCAGTIPRAGFRERVDAAAAAGFSGITLFPEHYLDAIEHEGLDSGEMGRCLRDAGISVQQIDPLLDWYGDRASKSERLLYEAAAATGAKSINVAAAFAPSPDPGFLTEHLAALAERAAKRGLSIDLEFLPWSPIPNLEAAVSLVSACRLENLGVMLDSWHFFRSGGQLPELRPAVARWITGVQLNDAPLSPERVGLRQRWEAIQALAGWARSARRVLGARDLIRLTKQSTGSGNSKLVGETLTQRLLPGEGQQAIAELLAALDAAHCQAPIGVEVFNTGLHRLSARDAASQAMEACRQVSRT